MKRWTVTMLAAVLMFSVTACGQAEQPQSTKNEVRAEQGAPVAKVEKISPAQGRALMAQEQSFVLLDVREPHEYKAGHIPKAKNLPLGQIETKALKELPDKGQLIIVYCQSGRRSAMASAALVQLGYTRVMDMGGIKDWPYEIEK